MTLPALDIYRGETTSFHLEAAANGAARNLDGLTLECQIKLTAGAADPALVSLTVGSGITLDTQSGDTLGHLTVTFSATQTDSLTAGIAYLDVWAISGLSRKCIIKPRRVIVRDVVNPP